jgi:hypothetical protein
MLCALTVRTLKPGTSDQFLASYVESVGVDGLYDVVEDVALAPSTTA